MWFPIFQECLGILNQFVKARHLVFCISFLLGLKTKQKKFYFFLFLGSSTFINATIQAALRTQTFQAL